MIDGKIEEYQVKFRELKSALQERAVVQTEITVLRILDIVENIGVFSHYQSETYAHIIYRYRSYSQ